MRILLLFVCLAGFLSAQAHIFLYHRFDDARYPSTSISTDKLKEQFQYLKDNDYQVLPLDELITKLKNGENTDKLCAITIDDGYKSFMNAVGVFEEFGYPYTMFVYVKAADDGYGDFMGWDELRALKERGGDLQFHSYAHHHQARLDAEALRADFAEGLGIYERELGEKPKFYTYPYGEYTDETTAVAKEFGFEAIFNQNSGPATSRDLHDIDRTALGEDTNLRQVLSQKPLEASWIEPKRYSANLARIHAKIQSQKERARLYITGHGWREVEMNEGVIDEELDLPLTNPRTRLIIRVGDQITTKMLAKE